MRVLVVGAGAIGTLVAFSLAAEHDVRVAVRDAETANAIRERGGVVLDGASPRAVVAVPFASCSSAVANVDVANVDVAIVAVKTYATVAALAPLRSSLDPSVPIVSFQNGVAAVDQVECALGARRAIALAPTTEAATLVRAGEARRTAHGLTSIGWARGRDAGLSLEPLAAALTTAGLAAGVAAPIEPAVWGKLVVNAAINPVTALAGVANGVLPERPELWERACRAAHEAAAVARALGVRLPFDDPCAAVAAVARATAANRSSMLQDLERGRETEIEEISGAIVACARALGIPVPETASLRDEVRARAKA